MALAVGDLRAIIVRTAIVNGVLAQLVERLNGIEGFVSRKSFVRKATYLLCHKLVSQSVATRSRYGAWIS
jgi:hypothetical protein